jgi:hypothetical protein
MCEDISHLWNVPRLCSLSHQTYVLNSETYFEPPNLRLWQQRWRWSTSSGFSRCQPTHRQWRCETSHCLHLHCQTVQISLHCLRLEDQNTAIIWNVGHLTPRVRMSKGISLIALYAFMAWKWMLNFYLDCLPVYKAKHSRVLESFVFWLNSRYRLMVYSVCLLQDYEHEENGSARWHAGLILVAIQGIELDDPGKTCVIYHSVHGGRKLVLTVSFCYLE